MDYFTPRTVEEAVDILRDNERGVVFAGGTDLMVKRYDAIDEIEAIIDISRIHELKGIREEKCFFSVGALVTHQELVTHESIGRSVRYLSHAAEEIGSPQIRHRGTIGGNIVNASPAADLIPPLSVLNAELVLFSEKGERKIPLRDFFTGPGNSRIAKDELLTQILFPVPSPGSAGCFIKLGRRKALSIAVAGIAAYVETDEENRRIQEIRLSLSSVAPYSLRPKKTEEVLRGKALERLPIEEAVRTVKEEVKPIDDIRATAAYRKEMCGTILEKALHNCMRDLGFENTMSA